MKYGAIVVNYWFPVNMICSNLNSQAQGDENDVAMAQRLQIQNMGLHFPRSLHLMTQRQCAEVDEITDYMVMSAFMIFIQKIPKKLGQRTLLKLPM